MKKSFYILLTLIVCVCYFACSDNDSIIKPSPIIQGRESGYDYALSGDVHNAAMMEVFEADESCEWEEMDLEELISTVVGIVEGVVNSELVTIADPIIAEAFGDQIHDDPSGAFFNIYMDSLQARLSRKK